MNLFVTKLNFDTTQDTLQALFEEFGEVSSCKLIVDRETGRSKGFAFVEMPNEDNARAAIESLHMARIEGRQVIVKEAEDRPQREGGYRGGGDRREGGYRGGGDRREGGYRGGGDRREGGYRGGGDRREGGYRGGGDRDQSFSDNRGNDRPGRGNSSQENRDGGRRKQRDGGKQGKRFDGGGDKFERAAKRGKNKSSNSGKPKGNKGNKGNWSSAEWDDFSFDE
ncbi:MAG: RNA-binding protein [Saprospirales bacterium]|nr:RNA-binding protein [Saprospirales bacterium]